MSRVYCDRVSGGREVLYSKRIHTVGRRDVKQEMR